MDAPNALSHVRELALSGLSLGAILATLDALRDDPEARVVLLHAGDGATPALSVDDECLLRLERFALPVVFAFEGLLQGEALAVALACDIRVCGAQAAIDTAGLPGARAAGRLALLAGPGVPVAHTATEALQHGLVSRVAPAGAAVSVGREVAAAIASRGPIATQLAKEAIWRGLQMPLEQALRFETDLTLLLQTTKDRAEGVRAFLEKRPPVFTGE